MGTYQSREALGKEVLGQQRLGQRNARDIFSYPNLPPEPGEVKFSTTCDLWKFAHKVRLAVSRKEPAAERYYDPTPVKDTAEYCALCTVLDEHKEAQHPPSRKSKRR